MRFFKKNQRKFLFLVVILFLFFPLFFIHQSRAATITNFKVNISDSRPSQTNVIYDFEGNLRGNPIKCIKVDFCTTASGACSGPTGLDVSGGSKALEIFWNDFSYYNFWSYSSLSNNSFKLTYDSGMIAVEDTPGAGASWAIAGITNASSAGNYYTRVNTYSDAVCLAGVDSGITAFANTSGVSFSLTIPDVAPVLTSIVPSSRTVGSDGFVMDLSGANFISTAIVRFAGSDRATTYINPTTLTAQIASSDLQVVGDYNITVFNPGSGESNPLVFSVVHGGVGPGNPVPILISINPNSKNKGDPGFTMTLTGNDFIPSSVVLFAGLGRSTTYINSTTLEAEILASDLLVAGDFDITVSNPGPGGGQSGPQVFKVIDLGLENPIPVLNNISPNSKIIGDETFTMTLTGSDFIASSIVRFAGSDRITTYINSTTLTAQILSSDLLIAGNFDITVFNPEPGGGQSNVMVFRVNNPLAVLDSINPTWRYQNTSAFTISLAGSNFIASSVVRFAGSDRATTFVDSNTLQAEILVDDLKVAGDFNITVSNPGPGGGLSGSQVFKVLKPDDNPIPTLTSITPTWRYQNTEAFTMRLTGSDFIASSIVRFAGSARTTTFDPAKPNQLEAYILITDLQTLGDFNITVSNPGPGGGQSNPLVFSVVRFPENPVPILTSINPTWRYQNSGAFTMTLTGSNFVSSSVVRFAGSNRSTTYINDTELQTQIFSSDLSMAGDFNITVSNPGPGGGLSGSRIFKVLMLDEEPPDPSEPEIPAPTIQEPRDGTFSNQPITTIKGIAQANQSVELFINDQKERLVYADENGNWQTTIELKEGSYFLFVISQEKKSNIVKLVIDLTPPEPPILIEANVLRQTFLLTTTRIALLIKGESSPDSALIRLVVGPEFVFSPEAEKWERIFDMTLKPGRYQVYAFAYDLAGNISRPSNVLEFQVDREIIPPLMVAPLIEETIRIIDRIISDPEVERVVKETSEIVLPIATAVSALATISVIASSGFSLLQLLPLIYLLFIQPFVLIFHKRKRRGWGVVYNSLTKQPVDLAPVRLFDAKTNRLISTRISDRAGRYFFTVNPGRYRLVVNKSEHVFPSKYLAGFNEDFRYSNLYQGQEIEIKEKNTIINANIPIDPDKQIKSDKWLVRDHLNFSLKRAVPIAVLIMSVLSYIVSSNSYLLGLVVVNVLLFIAINAIRPRIKKDWGIVADKNNRKPLPLTVVRIFESSFDKLIDQQVTNTRGQYGFLVGGRKFYLTYNKKGYQEKESPVLDFQKKERGEVVNLDVYLEEQKKQKEKEKNASLSAENKEKDESFVKEENK